MFGFLFKKKKVVVTARRPVVRNVDFYKAFNVGRTLK